MPTPLQASTAPTAAESRAETGAGRWLIATAFWLAASVTAPAIMIGTAEPMHRSARMTALAVGTMFYAGTRLALLMVRDRPALLQGTVWLFVYVSLGVAPVAEVVTGLSNTVMDTQQLIPAAVLAAIAMVAFDLGGWLRTVRRADIDGRQAEKPARDLDLRRLRQMSMFAILGSFYYIATLGGPAVFFRSREDMSASLDQSLGTSSSNAASAIVGSIGIIPSLLCLAAWLAVRRRGQATGASVNLWIVALAVVNLIVNNPIGNSRYWFLAVACTLLLSTPRLNANRYAATLILGIVAAVLVFPHADYFRVSADRRGAIVGDQPVLETLATKDYDQHTMTANGLWWVNIHGHTNGLQAASDALFWVPRSVWPGKGEDTGTVIGRAMRTPNINLSSPLWIEAFIDFGWGGVLVVFLLLGWFVRRADTRFALTVDRHRQKVLISDLLIPFMAGYMLVLMRGPLLQATGRLVVMTGALWWMGARQASKEAEKAHSAVNLRGPGSSAPGPQPRSRQEEPVG